MHFKMRFPLRLKKKRIILITYAGSFLHLRFLVLTRKSLYKFSFFKKKKSLKKRRRRRKRGGEGGGGGRGGGRTWFLVIWHRNCWFNFQLQIKKNTETHNYTEMKVYRCRANNNWPKSRILHPKLNNNWITVVIGRFRHVTCWTTLRLFGGRIQDLDLYMYLHVDMLFVYCGCKIDLFCGLKAKKPKLVNITYVYQVIFTLMTVKYAFGSIIISLVSNACGIELEQRPNKIFIVIIIQYLLVE